LNIVKKYLALIISAVALIIYLITLAPSVVQIDSGELAAIQITLGIAHPTGYPLYTILGYLFSLLPLPFSKIYQMNLLAAIYCAAAVGFFVQSVKFTLDNLADFSTKYLTETKKQKKKTRKEKGANLQNKFLREAIPDTVKIFASAFGGLVLAFSKTFWFQSTSVEVYSLHLLLICIIIFVLLKAYLQSNVSEKFYRDFWFILAIVLALGFSNHMTTLLILPAIAYLFFSKLGFNKSSINKLFLMIALFLPILLVVYSYLPFRASQQPIINWGNPIDLARILRHISGKQYQVWLFSSMEAAKKQLGYFFSSLTEEYNIALISIIIGCFFSYKNSKKIFALLSILFSSTVLYSINYDIVDIDAYFLLAYISLAFFSAFGIVKLYSLLKLTNHSNLVLGIVSLIFIIIFASFNFKKVDQLNTRVFEDYTKSLMNSMDNKSIVLSYQWDFFISASYYFQNVEGFRKDVVIIDKELLRRSWYYNQLKRNYPEILLGLENEVKIFLDALKPFERSDNYNSQLLESLYRQIMTKIISTNIDKYSIYLAPEMVDNEMQKGEFNLPPDYYLVPDLFLFKVVKTKEYIPANEPNFNIQIPERRNYYVNFIEEKVGSMLARRAIYEMQNNKYARAKIYINKIKKALPEYKLSTELMQAFER
jgi:hypothetical protein